MSAYTKDEEQLWTAITKNDVISEMLALSGDQFHIAIRAKIIEYAEDVFVIWLAVGIKYIRVNNFK